MRMGNPASRNGCCSSLLSRIARSSGVKGGKEECFISAESSTPAREVKPVPSGMASVPLNSRGTLASCATRTAPLFASNSPRKPAWSLCEWVKKTEWIESIAVRFASARI